MNYVLFQLPMSLHLLLQLQPLELFAILNFLRKKPAERMLPAAGWLFCFGFRLGRLFCLGSKTLFLVLVGNAWVEEWK